MKASLVMRDRETDSWWGMMAGSALGGEMKGALLKELPLGEKITWGEWRQRHPETIVLTSEGKTHDENHYDGYFTSDRTFRGMEVEDDRLAAKDLIYSFRIGDETYAAPHRAFSGGNAFETADGSVVFLYRKPGASIYESTTAFRLPADSVERGADGLSLKNGSVALKGAPALDALDGTEGAERLNGFDTYWYTWVAVNDGTHILE